MRRSNSLRVKAHQAIFVAAAATAMLFGKADTARADYTVTVNPAQSWGVWQGWGCSLSWWATVFGDRDDVADLLFTRKSILLVDSVGSQTLPGLGLNVIRYNVGGTGEAAAIVDGTLRPPNNPPQFEKYKRIDSFWLNGDSDDTSSSSWDWSKDAEQREMMFKAKTRGADTIEMFSDSPPWWMNSNLSSAGGDTGRANLKPENDVRFAVYLASVAQYAANNWGIVFSSVEPFNEPSSGWWAYPCRQEGCHIGAKQQQDIVQDLRRELDRRGLDTVPIAASDENTYDLSLRTWNALSPVARSMVGQLNTHGYEYRKGRRDLLDAAARAANLPLWNSETGDNDKTGMTMAQNISYDLAWLHPSVWCMWQPLDGSGWGLIYAEPENHTIGAANIKYYMMAQYTRHIRPGMIMLDSDDPNTTESLDAKTDTLVIVTVNSGPAESVTYSLNTGQQSARECWLNVRRWETDASGPNKYTEYPDSVITDTSLMVHFPARSVQTIEITKIGR